MQLYFQLYLQLYNIMQLYYNAIILITAIAVSNCNEIIL